MQYDKNIRGEKTEGFLPQTKKVYIYWLLDPVSQNIRYVGKTNNPRKRYDNYMSAYTQQKDIHLPIMRWVTRLRADGRHPIMHLEELVPANNWESREKYWIAYYKARGFRLLNILPGGGGTSGFIRPEEVCEKISNTLQGHSVSQETRALLRAAQTGRTYDQSTKDKVSEAGRRRWAALSPEAKAAHLASKKKPVWTPEMRAALGEKKRLAGRADGSTPGVRYNPKTNKWQAELTIQGVRTHLGSFETKESAVSARLKAQ